jgi:hypothetical protein
VQVALLSKKLGYKLTAEALTEAFAEMDPDGDGEVSFLEFHRWWVIHNACSYSRRWLRFPYVATHFIVGSYHDIVICARWCGGGESFLRGHWVAVPKTTRARRVNNGASIGGRGARLWRWRRRRSRRAKRWSSACAPARGAPGVPLVDAARVD